jgi:hypothetical protein
MPVDPAEFRHIESPAVRFTQDEAGLGKLEVASALATAFIFVQGRTSPSGHMQAASPFCS